MSDEVSGGRRARLDRRRRPRTGSEGGPDATAGSPARPLIRL